MIMGYMTSEIGEKLKSSLTKRMNFNIIQVSMVLNHAPSLRSLSKPTSCPQLLTDPPPAGSPSSNTLKIEQVLL